MQTQSILSKVLKELFTVWSLSPCSTTDGTQMTVSISFEGLQTTTTIKLSRMNVFWRVGTINKSEWEGGREIVQLAGFLLCTQPIQVLSLVPHSIPEIPREWFLNTTWKKPWAPNVTPQQTMNRQASAYQILEKNKLRLF